ncbi:MAG: FliH/SctL family protein [Planctomycetota bacterium]
MSNSRIELGFDPARLVGVSVVRADSPRAGLGQVVERLCDEARAEGFAQGVATAHETSAQALDAAAERLDAFRDEARTALGRTAVELAAEIARHLIRAEVETGRHDVDRIVRETLQESGVGRGSCVVHVHPEDAKLLEGAAFRAGTELVPDIGVKRGDVQVETPNGLFVRDLDDAVRAIGERILESLR